MKKVLVIAAIVAVAFLAFRGCFGGWTTTWDQRLTLVVETPQGVVRGSAVTRVTNTESSGALVLPEARGVRSKVTGEAVIVELTSHRILFALLAGTNEWERDATHWVYPAYRLGEVESYSGAMRRLRAQPYDNPVLLPLEGWPILVTFDDIAKPDTLREVDPDDLDAAFGCVRTEGVVFPWREAGLAWRNWVRGETSRLSRELAAARAGIAEPAASALFETYFIVDDHHSSAADKLRLAELTKLFTPAQRREWQLARDELIKELPSTLPTPETLAAAQGGACHRLVSVTLEITRDAVTEGRVEEVLPWLGKVGRERATLIPDPPLLSTDLTNPEIQLLSPNEFSTELYK